MVLDIFLTLLLVLLNGFFVAAEFAIVKVRASQIDIKEGVSKKLSKLAKQIVNNLDAYLAATQLGITLASLGLGWIGEDVVTSIMLKLFGAFNLPLTEKAAHNLAIPTAFAVITILHIVFGELAPKSLAIRYPSSTTFTVALPLRIFYYVFKPFIWLLNGFANSILRMMGIRPIHGGEIHSEEELRIIIQESAESGAIQEIEQDIVERVFALGDRKVGELMTHRTGLVWFDIKDNLQTIKRKAAKELHSVYPVANGDLDNLLGVISVKDLFPENLSNEDFRLERYIRKPLILHESTPAYRALEHFKSNKLHYAIVVDEYGSIQGMIAMDDVVDALVGDTTEYNQDEYQIVKRDDHSWLADGQYPYFEFLNYFELQDEVEEEGNFNTLAGFLLEHLHHIPQAGEKLQWNDFTFEIVDMDDRRIDKVLIIREQED
jgi:CBS domain containing-hemolysin-like protein